MNALPTPTNLPTASATPTYLPTASATPIPTSIPTDVPPVTESPTIATLIESDASSVIQNGAWTSMSQPAGASGGSFLINSEPDSGLIQLYRDWGRRHLHSRTIIRRVLGGDRWIVLQQVGETAPVYEFNDRFSLSSLSNTQHSLRIIAARGVVAIDAFAVQGTVADTVLPSTPIPTSAPTDTQAVVSPPTATATSSPSPIAGLPTPPVYATMDDGAPDRQGTSGWALILNGAYGGTGLSWQLATNELIESLVWTTSIDLTAVSSLQTIQLSFASYLQAETGSATAEIMRDGENQWLVVANIAPSADWSIQTVDLSAFAGQIIRVQFLWRPDALALSGSLTNRWGIDAVSIQTLDTLTPTPTDTPTLIPP